MESAPTHEASQSADGKRSGRQDPVPMVVDVVLGVLLSLVGLTVAAVGVRLYTVVDRELLQEILTRDDVQLEGLTPAEAVAAGDPFVDWFAAGLAVTGVGLLVGAGVFMMLRRRTRRRVERTGGTTATFWACAVYGATVTLLLSFIPGSSAIGGGVAAYFHTDDPARVGAVSGLVAAAVAVPLFVFLAAGFLAGGAAIGKLAGVVELVGVLVIGQLFALTIGAAFGAAGGLFAERLL